MVLPTLVNLSGALTDGKGKPLTGITSITFSLYTKLADRLGRFFDLARRSRVPFASRLILGFRIVLLHPRIENKAIVGFVS